MQTANLTDHQKNQLLDAIAHYMDPDLRSKLMAELPQAYNAWAGSKILNVVHRDGRTYGDPSPKLGIDVRV